MEHPEHVIYVVTVYIVTFGLLAGYLLWLWRQFRAEKKWAQERALRHAPQPEPGHVPPPSESLR